jgi:hypothetical protein
MYRVNAAVLPTECAWVLAGRLKLEVPQVSRLEPLKAWGDNEIHEKISIKELYKQTKESQHQSTRTRT